MFTCRKRLRIVQRERLQVKYGQVFVRDMKKKMLMGLTLPEKIFNSKQENKSR